MAFILENYVLSVWSDSLFFTVIQNTARVFVERDADIQVDLQNMWSLQHYITH